MSSPHRHWRPSCGEHQNTPHALHFILSSTSQGRMASVRVTLRSGKQLGWERKCQLWLWALILLQGYQNYHMV